MELAIEHLDKIDPMFSQIPPYPRMEIVPSLKITNIIFRYRGYIKNLLIHFDSEGDDYDGNSNPKIVFSLQHISDEGGEAECLEKICRFIFDNRDSLDWINSIWFCENDVENQEYTEYGGEV